MIYIISNGKNIKIGRTGNLKRRIKELKTAMDCKLRLLYTLDLPDSMEKEFHKIFKQYHIEGEWYNPLAIQYLLGHPWYKENMKHWMISL